MYMPLKVIVFLYLLLAAQTSAVGITRDIETNQLTDFTKGLTDSQVESALDDLSVQELRSLSEFMDSAKTIDYNYVEDNFLENNIRAGPLIGENLEFDKNEQETVEMIYDDMNADDVLTDLDAESVVHYRIPKEYPIYAEDTPRSKRENTENPQMISVDEEYIKQLENSFPRDQDQSGHDEDHGDKKAHIRVKRF